MKPLSFILATRKHFGLLGILNWLKLLWWAICGRPIIHKVIFDGEIKLNKNNRDVLILNNVFSR